MVFGKKNHTGGTIPWYNGTKNHTGGMIPWYNGTKNHTGGTIPWYHRTKNHTSGTIPWYDCTKKHTGGIAKISYHGILYHEIIPVRTPSCSNIYFTSKLADLII